MPRLTMPEIRQLIEEYHQYEGDRNTSLVRRIPHPDGGEMYLVHFVDKNGKKYSSLDMISLGATGEYATEYASCPREDEHEMVLGYLNL